MSVIVDTNVLYAEHDIDASRHEIADSALQQVYDGELGQPYISDYIYDETVTFTLFRANSFPPAKQIGDRLRGIDPYPTVYEMVTVSSEVFEAANNAFERFSEHKLSFTDATTVALLEHHDIDSVLSFDDDFDGIIPRTDPGDLALR